MGKDQQKSTLTFSGYRDNAKKKEKEHIISVSPPVHNNLCILGPQKLKYPPLYAA
jgi:hypothetical protein